MFVCGYWRLVHVCVWIQEVCSCLLVDAEGLLVDTGGVFMFVCRYWRLVHACELIQEVCSCPLVDTGGLFLSVGGC